MAPEYPSPAAVQDGIATVEWLAKSTLNKNFVLTGDSAGGHIALMVALSLSSTQRRQLKALLLMYPALDPALITDSMQLFAEGYFVSKKNMQDFWNAYLGQSRLTWPLKLSQIQDLPPTLIQTADYDILRDEAQAFYIQLQKAGVEAEYRTYRHTAHGLMQMPNYASKRNVALRDIGRFVSLLSS